MYSRCGNGCDANNVCWVVYGSGFNFILCIALPSRTLTEARNTNSDFKVNNIKIKMPHLLQTCEEQFGTRDFYQILGLKKEASQLEIKKDDVM